MKQRLARLAALHVSKFIVHTRHEVEAYGAWLALPADRFEFIHLQAGFDIPEPLPETEPYVLAAGSAYRDYPTFLEAMGRLGHRTIVVAGARSIRGAQVPANVEVRSNIPREEFRRLLQRAAVHVLPMNTHGVAAGTSTITESFRLSKAVIATRRPGSDDYVIDGSNGFLVDPYQVDPLCEAIDRLWTDTRLQTQLDAAAASFCEANCSDPVAGRRLGEVLDAVEQDPLHRRRRR